MRVQILKAHGHVSSCSTVNNPGDILPPSITKDGYLLSFKWVPFVDGLGKVYYKHRVILTNSVSLPPGFTVDHKSDRPYSNRGRVGNENHKIYEGDHHPQYLGTLSGWEKSVMPSIHLWAIRLILPFRVNVSASNMVENLCAHYLGDSSATGGRELHLISLLQVTHIRSSGHQKMLTSQM